MPRKSIFKQYMTRKHTGGGGREIKESPLFGGGARVVHARLQADKQACLAQEIPAGKLSSVFILANTKLSSPASSLTPGSDYTILLSFTMVSMSD